MHSWKLRFVSREASIRRTWHLDEKWSRRSVFVDDLRAMASGWPPDTVSYARHTHMSLWQIVSNLPRTYRGIATSTLLSKGYQLLLKEPDSLNTQRFSRGFGLRSLLMASIHPSRWQHDPEICLGTPIQLPYSDKECVANHELGLFVLDNRRILRTSTHFESPVHVHRLLFLFRRNLLDLGMFWW